MKIHQLSVKNFLGIGAVTLIPSQPVVMVVGPNGAGKTSLCEAIRLAFLGDVPRIDLMRDAQALVKAGAERGSIQVTASNGSGHQASLSVSVPDRKRTGDTIEALRWSLEPAAFARLDNKERMKTILQLSKAGMSREAIIERLMAHGIEDEVVEELGPQLVLGFEACAAIAKEKAAESRGAWRQLTGETYGSKKAEGWRAPATGDAPEAPASLEASEKAEQAARELVTILQTQRAAAEKAKEGRARDAALGMRLQPLKDQIKLLQATLGAADDHPRHVVDCPHCGASFTLGDDFALITTAVHDGPRVKPAAKTKAKAELAAAQKELAIVEAAAARAADPTPAPTSPSDDQLDVALRQRDEAIDVVRSLRASWEAYSRAKVTREQTNGREVLAAQLHAQVAAWEKAETALLPGGIPSELAGVALAPLRAALREVCASPAVSTWPLPDVGDEGSISARGRPYALLSRSEQYRVDLLLAAALAVVSDTRILVADEADVLEPAGRGELQNWLLDMTEQQDGFPPPLEAAWVFMTLKASPQPVEGVSRYWLTEGGAHA